MMTTGVERFYFDVFTLGVCPTAVIGNNNTENRSVKGRFIITHFKTAA
jgi:hypothetical protein